MCAGIRDFIFALIFVLLLGMVMSKTSSADSDILSDLVKADKNDHVAIESLLEEYNQERYVPFFQQQAKLGSAAAKYWLAQKYMDGEIINHDIVEAEKLYIEAANLGNAASQLRLYFLYSSGAWGQDMRGIYKDEEKAEKNLNKAIKAEYPPAIKVRDPKKKSNVVANYKKTEVLNINDAAQRDDFLELYDIYEYIRKSKNACEIGSFTETSCICDLKEEGKIFKSLLDSALERNPDWKNKMLKFKTEFIGKYGVSHKSVSMSFSVFEIMAERFQSKWCIRNETL